MACYKDPGGMTPGGQGVEIGVRGRSRSWSLPGFARKGKAGQGEWFIIGLFGKSGRLWAMGWSLVAWYLALDDEGRRILPPWILRPE